jgi:hypothetical protein
MGRHWAEPVSTPRAAGPGSRLSRDPRTVACRLLPDPTRPHVDAPVRFGLEPSVKDRPFDFIAERIDSVNRVSLAGDWDHAE